MDGDSINIDDLSFDEKIAFLEEELPVSVRDFLRSPERDAVSLRLTQKYRLHADQAAAFEKAYLYMLLGVNTPEDFVQDLKEANIPLDTIRGLTNDINEQVFKKLQQTELHGVGEQATAPQPGAKHMQSQVPVMQVAPPQMPPVQETSRPPVTPQEPPPYNLMRPDALAPAPTPAHAQTPVPASAPQPMLRTMQTDMEAMQSPQHAAAPVPYTPSVISASSHMTPARSFQTASIPYSSHPVPSRPVPPLVNQLPPIPQQNISTQQPAPQHNEIPQADYTGDPYREPLS